MTAWLETSSGDRIPLHGSCSLGRHPSSTHVLDDGKVSRRHALIHTQGQSEHWLVDLGSSNGTLLNGRRIRQPVPLKHKDRLQIGDHILLYSKSGVESGHTTHFAQTTSYRTIRSSDTTDHWLLVADIEQFTPLSQSMPGDELARLVGTWICACKEIVEKHSGEINQYLGDGFLACWKSGVTSQESIIATLEELIQIQNSNPFKFRWVVHHGAITVDNSLAQGQNSLIGPDVNFVFRMEKAAGKLRQYGVLSEAAARNLGVLETTTHIGEHAFAGFNGTHALYSYCHTKVT